MQALLIRFLLRLAALLPLPWARALGRLLGRLTWGLGGRAQRVTARNIALAFPQLPPADRQRLAQRSLQATAELVAETGWVWHRPWPRLRRSLREVRGLDALLAALDSGRGVLVLGPHLGNWELLGLHLATLGVDTVTLYEPPQLRGLDGLLRAARQRTGARLVPTDRRGLSQLLRCLRGGGLAGVLPDQVPRRQASGANSEFMGLPCFTPTLAARLLQGSGARAFFAFAERVRGGFRLHYLPAPQALYSPAQAESLRALNAGVEHCLRHCPEQYQWEYKRFRTRPPALPDHYADT